MNKVAKPGTGSIRVAGLAPTVRATTSVPKSRRDLLKRYEKASERIRTYFEHLPKLLADLPLDVSLSYVFSQVELAQNTTLYRGVVKLHRANAVISRRVVDGHHFTREGFKHKFEVVFGKPIPPKICDKLNAAETIRDRVLHGKSTKEKQKREAIADVLDYAEWFNEFVYSIAKIHPFGDLRGFKGRAQSLDGSTTRWILKGMGFDVS